MCGLTLPQDPYVNISRMAADGSFTLVHKTDILKNTLNPNWKPFKVHPPPCVCACAHAALTAQQLTLSELCNGDLSRPLLFECYDWDAHGAHDLIGTFRTTVLEMQQRAGAGGTAVFELVNAQIAAKKKKNYRHSGELNFVDFKVVPVYSFVDYLMGGLSINLMVGVDFTGSNGAPSLPTSLHHINSDKPNQYQQVPHSVVWVRSVG